MRARSAVMLAAVAGFSAVALGAFGAHGLKKVLSPQWLTVYQTGVQYHLIHAVVLLAVGLILTQPMPQQSRAWLARAAWLLLVGLLLFSGSLYALAVSGVSAIGMITPIGGVSWLLAWVCIGLAGRQFSPGVINR
ncbi:hypothetical protein CHH28_03655 [Bacterioplanes sanyensis]|uniref:DUF423 domain-containing protein n=1 Tax=Bacterioplanes sanyensis TaxID=1249553 RepID=A0A222FHX2_9GAMM|nr:DUF423 domain-containing protein [Bacterioplanes sanyensis]ASP37823.1 hypothetical protein CHH28_03655 [Bacterioplanes sanyensis]